jgi:hypothetical protein
LSALISSIRSPVERNLILYILFLNCVIKNSRRKSCSNFKRGILRAFALERK